MEWLKDILKHLAISRLLVGAVFVTSTAMFWGPKLVPAHVPQTSAEWLPAIFGGMVLTGCLLLFWTIAGLWHALTRGVRSVKESIAAANISQNEAGLLAAMGKNPSEPLNLDRINYEEAPFARLELMETCSALDKKGLVRINEYAENLVSLTPAGRERALEIIRESRGGSAA